ncbi:hypothetical protein V493_00002, partial [Pseudogymnoascus sp. VKM F-4281 (FW-2241)]
HHGYTVRRSNDPVTFAEPGHDLDRPRQHRPRVETSRGSMGSGPPRLGGPTPELEGRLEEGRQAVALLERRVQEARERKRLAVKTRIAELEAQERHKKALKRELYELLRQDSEDS